MRKKIIFTVFLFTAFLSCSGREDIWKNVFPLIDGEHPTISKISVISKSRISITFSEEVDSASANNAENYTILNQKNKAQTVSVDKAVVNAEDQSIVDLSINYLVEDTSYTVSLHNISDKWGNSIAGWESFEFIIQAQSPVITGFSLKSNPTTYVPDVVLAAEGTDNLEISGWIITESPLPPAINDINWTVQAPTTYTLTQFGSTTLYAWAKDDLGLISAPKSVTIDYLENGTPYITSFILTSGSPTMNPNIAFVLTGTDNIAVTDWMITETPARPGSGDPGWVPGSAPASYTLLSGLGTVTVYAWAKDVDNNVSYLTTTSHFDVVYEDDTPPAITMLGTSPVTIEAGTPYIDAGATAFDTYDGDITAGIIINNPVDINIVGTYSITYNVIDSSGNPATAQTRTVYVVDTQIPVLTLLGIDPETIEAGSLYFDTGAAAFDGYDGDISSSIIISNPVDVYALGAYTVTYDVMDSSGNTAVQITRTVNVIDTTLPVITLVGANPQTIEAGNAYTELGATASDNYDGNISGLIVINSSAVNISALGSYAVTYNVSDSNGNAAVQQTRTVNVVDTTIPVITLVGANPQVIAVGSPYTELGATAADNYDGDISASIVIDTSTLVIGTVGSYSVTYNVTDSSANPALQKTRTVNVVDTVIPVITLTGANPQIIPVGSPYTELGATASDNYDGDISASIVIDTSSLVIGTVGSYSVTYNVTDSSANPAVQKTRTVNVVDTVIPVITLTGANPQIIQWGAAYTELGATAFDSYDGDISGSIIIDSSTVNTSLIGSYFVTYNVTDSSGNPAAQKTRTVFVVDSNPPVITLSGANPQSIQVFSAYVESGATAWDNEDGDITGSIVIDSTAVNVSVLGSYIVKYDVSDVSANPAVQKIRTVNVVDNTVPVITLTGANPQVIQVFSSYSELGAAANDNYDGNISGSIVINSTAVNSSVVGSYPVTYNVSDSSSNAAIQQTRNVNVVDTTIPVITMLGTSPVTVEVFNAYIDAGATALDNYNGNITGSIITNNTVNINIVGSYTVTYNVTDSSSNAAVQVSRTVNIVDTTAPVITMLGSTPVDVEVSTSYTDAGATALDNYDGTISGIITTNNPVNINLVGTYTVTYNVTDANGNAAIQKTRTVNVVDTTDPFITMLGTDPVTLEVGGIYSDDGATAFDNYDGDVTSSIVTTNLVNANVVGSYTVTYNVMDANGNAATPEIRTVNIVDTTPPVITITGANPQIIEVGSTYSELGATALDDYYGNISGSIVTDASAVNTSVLGSYFVTYNVTDASGNAAIQKTRTVNVTDTTAPAITLTGANPQVIEVGGSYTELGATALDNYDGNISGSISINATAVNTSALGSYSVTYNVIDSSGNAAAQKTRTVNVVDTTAPVITILGTNPVTLEVGGIYSDAGATALDNYDGDITGDIFTTDLVNPNVVGNYTVTYDVMDTNGNAAAPAVRNVNVVDTTVPVITLVGANPQTIEVGSSYSELGATASDNYDGDITGSIVINSAAVNTSALGSYSVTYNVTDVHSNAAVQKTRTVNVVDTTIPVITLTGANPQTIVIGTSYTELGATALDNYYGDISGSIVIDSSAVNTSALGSYFVTYNVTDASGNGAAQKTRTVNVVPPLILYVKTTGNNGNDGFTPATAKATINGAFLSAASGCEIRVAGGTYTENISISYPVTLSGGWNSAFSARDPETTTSTITSSNSYTIALSALSSATQIDGFTITNSTSSSDGYVISINGMGPIISNNVIDATSMTAALQTSGIYCLNTAPVIERNRIIAGSTAGYNDGITLLDSDAVIRNNNITGGSGTSFNSAITSYGDGIHVITGNILFGGYGTWVNIGIDLENPSTATIQTIVTNNTICAGTNGTEGNIGIVIYSGGMSFAQIPVITNNIVFSMGSGADYAISEDGNDSDPASVQYNNIFNVNSYFYRNDGTDITDITSLNGLDGEEITVPGGIYSQYNDNVSGDDYSLTPDLVFVDYDGPDNDITTMDDNDWRLATTNASFTSAGWDTSATVFGYAGQNISCGDITQDIDGRPAPGADSLYTVGAYEVYIPINVLINQAAGQPDPANTTPISFDVLFDNSIDPTTFTASDITQNGTATGITWQITNLGDDKSFTLSTTAIAAEGTVIPSIAADMVQNTSGTRNSASTSTDNSVTFYDMAYVKASNPDSADYFGMDIAIDGNILVVGAQNEDSSATGINGNESLNDASQAGAAYVYMRNGNTWTKEAYLKGSNTETLDNFGRNVDISGDTIVVGAYGEDSNATGVNGNESDNSISYAGTAYVFVRSGGVWLQQAYLKASNTGPDFFGFSVAISGDLIAVGAYYESSNATGVNGNQADNSATASGAVYVFKRTGTTWVQEAYLKASNAETNDYFGKAVDISGNTIIVAADYEDSNATGINGGQLDNSTNASGAAYVFVRDSNGNWSQQAYIKASNTEVDDHFGNSVSIYGDTIAVSAYTEDSNATGINGGQLDNSASASGAVYVFKRTGAIWAQEAYVKASNTEALDYFGYRCKIDNDKLIVGADSENSSATYVNGNQADNSAGQSGATYLYERSGAVWSFAKYIKSSNTGSGDRFGTKVDLSGDHFAFGAHLEASNATGINGNQTDNSLVGAGAAYVYNGREPVITDFTLTSANPTNVQNITFTIDASDYPNGTISQWLINESFAKPASGDTGWNATKPTDYTVSAGHGTKYVYAWAKDNDGNIGPSRLLMVDYDLFGPGVTINQAVGQADPTNNQTIIFDVTFSESINAASFTTDDISQAGSPITVTWNITNSGDNKHFTISTVTISGNGMVFPKIMNNLVQDLAGNNNAMSAGLDTTVTYDNTQPTVSINQTADQDDPTNNSNIQFDVEFNEEINPATFTSADISQTGTATGITWNIYNTGDNMNFTISTTSISLPGTIVPVINSGQIQDAAGNQNTSSTSTDNSVELDLMHPTVTVNQAVFQPDPTNNPIITFDVVFSEPVDDSELSYDHIWNNGSAGNIEWDIINLGDDIHFTLTSLSIGMPGTVEPNIGSCAVRDAAWNCNSESTHSDNKVTYDNTSPTVMISQAAGQLDPTASPFISFSVTFNKNINPSTFTPADITNIGSAPGVEWRVTNSGDDKNFTISTIAISGEGTVAPVISAGTVTDTSGNSNLDSTSGDGSVRYNLPPYVLLWTPGAGIVNNGETITVKFSENVTDADDPFNYSINLAGGGTVSISDITYYSGSYEAVLTISITGTSGLGNFTITVDPMIMDVYGAMIISNMSLPFTTPDMIAPDITSFTLTSGTPTENPVISFNLDGFDDTGAFGIWKWMITETPTAPSAGDSRWTDVKPSNYTLTTGSWNTYTLYAWAKDYSDNVSAAIAPINVEYVSGTILFVSTALGNNSWSGQRSGKPLKTINAATAKADAFSQFVEIRVAQGNYDETVQIDDYLPFTLGMYGGYDDSFTTRDPLSYVTKIYRSTPGGNTVTIAGNGWGITPTIDGFRIEGSSGNAATYTGNAIYILGSAQPIISNNIIIGGSNNTNTDSGNGIYWSFASGTVRGNNISTGTNNIYARSNCGIYLTTSVVSVPQIYSNSLISGGSSSSGITAGIRINDAEANIHDNTLIKGGTAGTASVMGIYIENDTSRTRNVIINNNTIDPGTGLDVCGLYSFANCAVTNNTFTGGVASGTSASARAMIFINASATANLVQGNTITGGNAPAGDGAVYVIQFQNSSTLFKNNIITAGSYGIVPYDNSGIIIYNTNTFTGAASPTIEGNTITVGQGASTTGIYIYGQDADNCNPVIRNNNITVGNATSTASYGVYMSASASGFDPSLTTFSGNTVYAGNANTASTSASSYGFYCYYHKASAFNLGPDNRIYAGTAYYRSIGFYDYATTAGGVISGNYVIAGNTSSNYISSGIYSTDTPCIISDNDLIKAGNASSTQISAGLWLLQSAAASPLVHTIERNNIYAGDNALETDGIRIEGKISDKISNNFIYGGASTLGNGSSGILFYSINNTNVIWNYIYNNVIHGGKGTVSATAIYVWDNKVEPRIINNILFTESAVGDGIYISGSAVFNSVRNNLFIKCPNRLFYNGISFYNSNPSPINTFDTNDNASLPGTFIGNMAVDGEPSTVLTDIFRNPTTNPAGTPEPSYHIFNTGIPTVVVIDKGMNINADAYYPINKDADNHNRPQGTGYDVGIDEYYGSVPSVSFTAASQSSTYEIGLLGITAQLSAMSMNEVTIPFTVNVSSTATSPDDYSIPASPIIIPAGHLSTTIYITINPDVIDENNETVIVNMGSPTNATMGSPSVHTATITDDDPSPIVEFSIAAYSGLESVNPNSVEVDLSAFSGRTITVDYSVTDGTAIGGGTDYNLANGTLSILPGDISKNISIPITQDTIYEANETFTITLSVPVNATLGIDTTTTMTIINDDPMPSIAFNSTSSSQGEWSSPAQVWISLSTVSGVNTYVDYMVGAGTADEGADYTLSSGTLMIPAGSASGNILVPITNDTTDEPNETVVISLANPKKATLSAFVNHTITITDDDNPPTVSFTTASQISGSEVGIMTITAQLSAASSYNVIVPFAVNTASTALNPDDYSIDTIPLMIPAGSTSAEIDIMINPDTKNESLETVIVDMGTPVNATQGAITQHTATINDDDPAPWVEFTLPSSSGYEYITPHNLTVDLSGTSGKDITVNYTVTGGTAIGGGTDYTISPGTLTIPAGSMTRSISIPLNNDQLEEPAETIVITLSAPSNATLGPDTVHTLTINDDDAIKVQFNSNFTFAMEQEGLSMVQVDLSTVSAANVSVDYSVTGGTATGGGVDYWLNSGTLSIPAGATTGYIYIAINDDTDEEPAEFIDLALSNPSGASLGWITSQEVRIEDNDTPWFDSQWDYRKKIFIIDHSESWDMEMLMPVSDVAGQINIPNSSGGSNHWTEIDDTPSDGGATTVWVPNGTPGSDFRDLYEFDNKTIGGAIESVKVQSYIYIDTPASGNARLAIKPFGSAIVYESGNLNPISGWSMYSRQWEKNPHTGAAWTQPDIDSLQAGVTLVENGAYVSCSMVNVIVYYMTGSDLTNYQVNINMTSSDFNFGDAMPNGEDLRFVQYDYPLQPQISYWIENYNSVTQTASIWAEVPNIPCNDVATLFMYYGNPTALPATDFDNTFTKDYGESGLAALWHMDDGTDPTADSSGNGNDAEFTGSPLWVGMDGGEWADRPDISFATGNSLDFAGSKTEYLFAPDSLSLDITDNITLEAWMTGTSANPGTETVILRPTFPPGIMTTIPRETAIPHYAQVDEATPDGDTTYVYTMGGDGLLTSRDLYNLTDYSGVSYSINSVTVYCTIKAVTIIAQKARAAIYTNGSVYESPDLTPAGSYTTQSYTWNNNPNTSLAWTWTEINNLQAGVTFARSGIGEWLYCTQVYVEVNYNTGDTDSLIIFKPDAYALGITASNNVFADINKTARVEYLLANPSTQWHHIAMTYNGARLLLYADGLEVSGTPYISSITSNTNDVILGYYLNAFIDEARVYNRALSADEIYTHYERRKYAEKEPDIYMGYDEVKP